MSKVDFDQWFCLSFNIYSSENLTEIAAKVCDEPPLDGGDELEFISFSKNSDDADEVFPFFNPDIRLGKSDTTSSSSEIDQLDGISPGTYCVWTPKSVESSPSPRKCKKSKSTGSTSTLRKFCDLVRRSNSTGAGGYDSFLFLLCSSPTKKKGNKVEKTESLKEKRSSGEIRIAAGKVAVDGKKVMSAHEECYVRNRTVKEELKRQSYLPYRRYLVGFFASNSNGMGRANPYPF